MRNTIVALTLGLVLVVGGLAIAGEDAPATQPAAETKTAPTTAAKKMETATPSPMHSILKWVGAHVADDCGCPSTAKGEKQWRTWFSAKDAKLAGLRDALVADGWNADRTIGFFKQMAAAKGGSCSSCDKSKDCGSCDKAKTGAAAPTGDAGTSGATSKKAGCCGSCNGGCDKSDKPKDCSGCDKAKTGAAAPTGDAGTSGTTAKKAGCNGGGCDKSDKPKDCSGCDKSKDCSGCDKSKSCSGSGCDKSKASGASAPTGDAGTTGASAKSAKCGDGPCPCTGKPKSECGGCDKPACTCGKDSKTSEQKTSEQKTSDK